VNRRESEDVWAIDEPSGGGSDGLSRALGVLRRRWLVCIIPAVAGAVAAYALAAGQPEKFESSASLLFRSPAGSEAVTVDTTRQAATNVDLVSSDEIAQRTAAALGGGRTLDSIRSQVSIAARGNSDLISIRARDEDPGTAAAIANTWAAQYIAFRRAADRSQINQTIALINERLAGLTPDELEGEEGATLRSRRNELEIQASLQTGNAEVVEEARPGASPVSPRPVRSAVAAGFLGLLLGIAAAFIINRFDRRIRGADQLEELLGLPSLGSIPRARVLSDDAKPNPDGDVPDSDAVREAFRVLRTNISFFGVSRKLDSILVTSAAPGEGKTTVAFRLARAYAEVGVTTLLVEGDLRRPVLAARLGLPDSLGLTNLLVSNDYVHRVVTTLAVGSGELDVMTAGPCPPNPQELLESDRMGVVMSELRSRYDMIVIDAPPVLSVADTASLVRHVGGLVIVSRLGVTTTDDMRRLRSQLRLLDARPLGIVVNAAGKERAFEYHGVPSGGGKAPAKAGRARR
jgi:capsular exopolysaccharide synthesis family protein